MTDITNTSFRAPAGPIRKMDVGHVFRTTYRTFRLAPWRLVGLALLPLVFSIVTAIPGLFQNPRSNGPPMTITLAILTLLLTVLQYVVQISAQGASIYAAGRLLAGTSFTVREAFMVGLRRFWPMLGLFILIALMVLAGLLLLIIPAFIAMCVVAAAMQACVIERRGPIESIKRSADLTSGNWWRMIGAYMLTFMVPLVGALVVFGGLGGGIAYAAKQDQTALAVILGAITGLLAIPVLLVFLGIGGVFLAVLFFELRQAKEGRGPGDAVAGVFD